jgi:hypothetical protein
LQYLQEVILTYFSPSNILSGFSNLREDVFFLPHMFWLEKELSLECNLAPGAVQRFRSPLLLFSSVEAVLFPSIMVDRINKAFFQIWTKNALFYCLTQQKENKPKCVGEHGF